MSLLLYHWTYAQNSIFVDSANPGGQQKPFHNMVLLQFMRFPVHQPIISAWRQSHNNDKVLVSPALGHVKYKKTKEKRNDNNDGKYRPRGNEVSWLSFILRLVSSSAREKMPNGILLIWLCSMFIDYRHRNSLAMISLTTAWSGPVWDTDPSLAAWIAYHGRTDGQQKNNASTTGYWLSVSY